jgi:uncharacterized protein (TIGR02147 family)
MYALIWQNGLWCGILTGMKPLFDYIDYRLFLAHYYEEHKRQSPHFSYRYFAQKAAISSPSFLKHVIDGKRNLTPAMAERFCVALKFNKKESSFFMHLVGFNQAQTSQQKQEHYVALRALGSGVQEAVLKADQYDYFCSWYIPIIRELVCLHDFKDDYGKLAAFLRPKITRTQAREAVALLQRLALIEPLAAGGYRQTSKALVVEDPFVSMAVRSFMQSMLHHAMNALEGVPREQRHISGVTVGISSMAFSVITNEIEMFKDRLKRIVTNDMAGERVYQLNISLFPVSEPVEPRSGLEDEA